MTRHSRPLEIRSESGEDDPLALTTRAVDDLRIASEAFRTEIGERVTNELRAIGERIDGLETRMQRPGSGGDRTQDAQRDLERRAFEGYIRRDDRLLSADEMRALRVSDNTTGGYLAPDQFVTELDRNLVLFSPVRQIARVAGTAAGAVKLPKRTANLTASWVGETETRPAAQSTYGMTELDVREIACYVDVSNQLLEDSAIDIEAELAYDFAEEFGRAEGAAFVGGNGVKQPLGLLNTPGIDATTKTGNSSGFATSNPMDAIFSLIYSLPTAYAARATFGMTRATMGIVRAFKDGQGRYLWQEPVAEGQPPTLSGRPVVEMPDMPEVAAGKTPVVFGDFSNFRIFDRISLAVLRDPFTQKTSGMTRFHGTRRIAAGVTKPEAFRLLTVSA